MKKYIYSITVLSIIFTLYGCTQLYTGPQEGSRARLRAVPLDIPKGYPVSDASIIAIKENVGTCLEGDTTDYILLDVANVSSKRGKSIGIPGKFEDHMNEVDIPAGKTIALSYRFHYMVNLSKALECKVSLSFIPEENHDYLFQALMDGKTAGKSNCLIALLDITEIDKPKVPATKAIGMCKK